MRSVPLAWTALETSRERQTALLIHIWAVPGGRVSWPAGQWGSWTYSVGFQGNVSFTDVANYAQDWSGNLGDPISRTYAPAAIEFDASQIFRNESTSLDPHNITLTVDPNLEPFATYVNRSWPVKFGITIYRVHRNGHAVATVDDGHGNPVAVADVAFVGYLNADDTLELNSAGLELSIDPPSGGTAAKAKMTTQWDHVTKMLDRLVPRPVFSVDCPKALFSTGNGAAVDCNADMPHVQVTGTVLQINGIVISALEWGTAANSAFAQGLIQYTVTDPVSGLDFTFTLNVSASVQRTTSGQTYGDLYLEMFPPLLSTGAVVQAFLGCDRTSTTCQTVQIPAGTQPGPAGAFTPGTLRVSLQLIETFTGSTGQQPKRALVYFNATTMWIVYGRNDSTQIGNIFVGPGTATPWNPTWSAQGSTIITSPVLDLAGNSLAGPPAQDGYHVAVNNDGATADIFQQPNATNRYVTVIHCRGGSAATYDFTIAWVANTGTAQNLGNLQNFGGAPIPIEHPSLETTA